MSRAPFVVQHYPIDGWAIMYRARLLGEPRPVDVRGLVWVPFAALDALVEGVQPGRLEALGITVLGEFPSSILFIGRGGLEDLLRTVHLDA